MTGNASRPQAYLDALRAQTTPEDYHLRFARLCETDARRAALLLNDERLSFSSLFAAREQIAAHNLKGRLSGRHLAALNIAEQILARDSKNKNASYLRSRKNAELSVLFWMLETGYREEPGANAYEEVLDGVAAVLLDLYREKRALPYVIEMIFLRASRGHNYHDLFWAVSRFDDPYALKLIAQRLDAPEPETAAFARELLALDETQANTMRYADYAKWLEENDPFLYFTGESLQFSGKPSVCRVDWDRKYANRALPAYEKQPFEALDDEEQKRLREFSALSPCDRAMLAEYAYRLRSKDPAEWLRFQKQPVAQQAEAAKQKGGGELWCL